MATYLSVVNSVLRRLREREVSSVNNNSYSRLIGTLVNDAKREVEDAWNWSHLRSTYQIVTEEDSFRYSLTNSGKRFRLLTDHLNRPSVFNDTDDSFIRKAPSSRWMSKQLNSESVQTGQPQYFEFNGFTSDEDVIVDFYPIPDGLYRVNFDFVLPQDDFSTGGSDDGTQIKCPVNPIVFGAWSRAIYERGEDNGYLSDLAYKDYQNALVDAISWDNNNTSDGMDWSVV